MPTGLVMVPPTTFMAPPTLSICVGPARPHGFHLAPIIPSGTWPIVVIPGPRIQVLRPHPPSETPVRPSAASSKRVPPRPQKLPRPTVPSVPAIPAVPTIVLPHSTLRPAPSATPPAKGTPLLWSNLVAVPNASAGPNLPWWLGSAPVNDPSEDPSDALISPACLSDLVAFTKGDSYPGLSHSLFAAPFTAIGLTDLGSGVMTGLRACSSDTSDSSESSPGATPENGSSPPGSDGDCGENVRCSHRKYWKRLRAKKQCAYFVCLHCGAKWRSKTASLGPEEGCNANE